MGSATEADLAELRDWFTNRHPFRKNGGDPKAIEAELTQLCDEIVHDLKSQEASETNNRGVDAQLRYIIESLGGVDAARAELASRLGGEEEEGEKACIPF